MTTPPLLHSHLHPMAHKIMSILLRMTGKLYIIWPSPHLLSSLIYFSTTWDIYRNEDTKALPFPLNWSPIQSKKIHFSSTRLPFWEIHLYRGWLLPSPPVILGPPLYLPKLTLNHGTQKSCNLRVRFTGRSAQALHYLPYTIRASHAVFSVIHHADCWDPSYLPRLGSNTIFQASFP